MWKSSFVAKDKSTRFYSATQTTNFILSTILQRVHTFNWCYILFNTHNKVTSLVRVIRDTPQGQFISIRAKPLLKSLSSFSHRLTGRTTLLHYITDWSSSSSFLISSLILFSSFDAICTSFDTLLELSSLFCSLGHSIGYKRLKEFYVDQQQC